MWYDKMIKEINELNDRLEHSIMDKSMVNTIDYRIIELMNLINDKRNG